MKRISVYVVIIVSLLLTVSCRKQEPLRIGVSQCSQDDWRAKMNDEIYREIMFHPEADRKSVV